MTARTFALAVATVISLTLGGCSLGLNATPNATPTPTGSAEPAPVFVPGGDAQDNKVFFDHVLSGVATIDQKQPGRAMVNALVSAGFRKGSIQVTEDLTKTQIPADSVIVAVRINRSCLVGQRTNDKEYFSSIESALKTGGCLVGTTRVIDW
ncbi:unannotated protein [freshwater metagenome]|jgi:hypothetical protein|uniref:Unannotated protein n=1 Tax=freshwater metagenome TaxID=449393 RepID=A0A6J7CW27_9ZZZZ|nr:hypothetical protein [Actinomycetota bacterium]